MQDQLTEAITNAVRATINPAAAPAAGTSRPGGRRLLAAMIAARDGDCDCKPCQLLIAELDEAIGDLLQGVVADAPSTNNQPRARRAR